MNKKIIPVLATGLVFALTSCGGGAKTYDRIAHKDFKGYSAKFYDSEKKEWVEKTGLSWAESYDKLAAQTKVTSGAIRTNYLQQCEDLIMKTGAICPLYYYTDIYLKSPKLTGFYDSPLGQKWFNGCKLDNKTEFTVCVGPKADSLDPALNSAVDGSIICCHNFEGLMKWGKPTEGHVSNEIVPGAANGKPTKVVNEDGTVTYTFNLLKEDGQTYKSKFSDGTDVTEQDWLYSWSRAASGLLAADYGYMFDCIKGYEDTAKETKTIKNLSGVDASTKGQLKVTINSDLPYFEELCAFPTFFPVKKANIEKGDSWWTSAATYIGNGPMKATTIDNKDGGSFVFEPNTNYHTPAENVATKITFALSDDDDNQYTNYTSGDWCFVDSIPQGKIDECKAAAETKGYFCDSQIGTYYVIFNVNNKEFNKYCKDENDSAKLRNALSLLIDRSYICKNIGKADQKPAGGFVGFGAQAEFEEGKGKEEWCGHNGYNHDGKGYIPTEEYYDKTKKAFVTNTDYSFENNVKQAVEDIKSLGFNWDSKNNKFTNFPTIKYLYNNGTGHKAIGEYLQGAFKLVGIKMTLDSQEWAVFLNTRKDGNYTMARNGWLGDYTDPCSFLDMWTTDSGNNDAQFGRDWPKTN